MENNMGAPAGAAAMPAQGTGSKLPAKNSLLKEIFGQFVTVVFWKALLSTVMQQMLLAFFIAIGDSFRFYGSKKLSPDVGITPPSQGVGSPAAAAFSGQTFNRPPAYSGTLGFQAPVASPSEGFPGFAR